MSLDLFQFSNLSQIPGVVHGITSRQGGVSSGRWESLNVSYSVGDSSENVRENLRRVADAIGSAPTALFSAYQVHGRSVTVVDPESLAGPRCDALVTRSSANTLMLRFADCTPVLLADPRQKAIGAVHAGWRGSAVRTSEAAVSALVGAFGSDPWDLLAGIGPAIGPCCYAVGPDVVQAFADRPNLIKDRKLNLWEANREALVQAGVPAENIEVSGVCTQCQSDRFFSHRANSGQPAGRFAALIKLA